MVLSQPDLAVQYQAAASDESIAAKELADGFVDPALKWQVTQAKQLGGGPANLTRVYETTVTLEVQRECGYYVGNYLMLESILVLLAWITFLISPECTETRLSIALTLVLAINVFQIVLVENLPETASHSSVADKCRPTVPPNVPYRSYPSIGLPDRPEHLHYLQHRVALPHRR